MASRRTRNESADGFHFNWPDEAVPEIFHAGERWTPGFYIEGHVHDVWEFYLQVSGQSVWSAPPAALPAGKKPKAARGQPTARPAEAPGTSLRDYVLEAGGFLAVGPNVPHRMRERAAATQHFLYAAIDLDAVFDRHPGLKGLWDGRQVVFTPQGAALQMPFRSLIREVSIQLPQRQVGMRLALDLLVVEATRLLDRSPGAPLIQRSRAVSRAKELIDQQPQRPWGLQDLARLTSTSAGHLAESFTRDVGVPPHRYLLQVRIERIKELLKTTDIPITQLALEFGFSSSQHFSITFKKLAGTTAQKFRADR